NFSHLYKQITTVCILAKVDKIFKDLDANSDGSVDFQEYVTLVACLTMMCNDFFIKK
uniref:EF-hand domain-containing protein n=1 Tax=Hucho hucho TaxID=62062 RepID=A0A4W5LDD9_9TELE